MADAVPVFRPNKIAHLMLKGHVPSGLALHNGNLIVLFPLSDQLTADQAAYDAVREAVVDMQTGKAPLALEPLLRVVKEQ